MSAAYKLNGDNSVAVDRAYFWLEMETAPAGVKLQLLSKGGVALHGQISASNRADFRGWTPLPQRRPANPTKQ